MRRSLRRWSEFRVARVRVVSSALSDGGAGPRWQDGGLGHVPETRTSSRRCRNSFSGRQLKKAPWSDISARPLASLCVGAPCARRGRHEIQEQIGGRSPVEAERSVQ